MTTEEELTKLARELHEKVLAVYKQNPNLTYDEILNVYLLEYNVEVAKLLNSEIGAIMNASVGSLSGTVTPLVGIPLSSTLYKNSKYVAKQTTAVLNEHLAQKSTLDKIALALYDGYGYDEVIQIAKENSLPKYLTKNITEAKINKLKTKSLKAGYLAVLDAQTDAQLDKALYVATEEKARYYAYRIAVTEEQKAFNTMLAAEYLDEGIEYVKWTLSRSHKTPCVCDFYATQNVGYGAGIYPINDAPVPAYSSHPFCKCVLRPADNVRRWNVSDNTRESALKKFNADARKQIERGLYSGWGMKTVGELFN